MSHVMVHVLRVMCHTPHFFYKVVKPIGGGSSFLSFLVFLVAYLGRGSVGESLGETLGVDLRVSVDW